MSRTAFDGYSPADIRTGPPAMLPSQRYPLIIERLVPRCSRKHNRAREVEIVGRWRIEALSPLAKGTRSRRAGQAARGSVHQADLISC